jgi:hypothetical protein
MVNRRIAIERTLEVEGGLFGFLRTLDSWSHTIKPMNEQLRTWRGDFGYRIYSAIVVIRACRSSRYKASLRGSWKFPRSSFNCILYHYIARKNYRRFWCFTHCYGSRLHLPQTNIETTVFLALERQKDEYLLLQTSKTKGLTRNRTGVARMSYNALEERCRSEPEVITATL